MNKIYTKSNKIIFFLILFSVFFWDLRVIPERFIVNNQIFDKALSNLDSRFIYLLGIIPIIFSLRYILFKKIISFKFTIVSSIILFFFIIHQIFTSDNITLLELTYFIVIFITLFVLKVYGGYFLDNKTLIIHSVSILSVFFYVFSLIIFDFLEIRNNDGELLKWNRFSFEPCRSGFYNNYNFVFSESSHFAMIAISIFLTNFYLIIEKNFKDIKLIISFVIFSFVVFNNMSLTMIVGIILCQLALIIVNLRKTSLKYILSSFLMLVFFVVTLLNFSECKNKTKNAMWLVKQKIPFLKIYTDNLNLELQKKEETKEEDQFSYSLSVNTSKGEKFVKNFKIKKTTDLSSAVLAHNLRVVENSIFSKPLGWGLNRYSNAFEYYTKYQIDEINHTYAIYVNNEDGSLNFTKIIVEYGLFSLFLVIIYTIFIFSKNISLSDKALLFPIIFVQVFLRGAGYFNGGFLIATILIIFIIFNLYERKISEKSY